MLKIEISTVINRPVEEVFAVVSNFENNPKWNPSSLEVKKTSAGPIGRGTTWRSVANVIGRRLDSESEFIEYEPNRKITSKGKQGPIQTKSQVTFEGVEGGTRVDLTLEGEPGGFFKLTEPLLVKMGKRQFEGALANLKDLMEARAL
jgi:uncharacterized membrane protein